MYELTDEDKRGRRGRRDRRQERESAASVAEQEPQILPSVGWIGWGLSVLMLGLAAGCAWGLRQGWATAVGVELSWWDATFMGVSAATCCGLTTWDVMTTLSPTGLAVVLGTAQLGAWSVMLTSSAIASRAFGWRWTGWRRTAMGVVVVSLIVEGLAGGVVWVMDGFAGTGSWLNAWGEVIGAWTQLGIEMGEVQPKGWVMVGVLWPVMLVGSLGYPVWIEGWRRVRGQEKGRKIEPGLRGVSALGLKKLKRKTGYVGRVLAVSGVVYVLGVLLIGTGQASGWVHGSFDLGVQGHGEAAQSPSMSEVSGWIAEGSGWSISARTTGREVGSMSEVRPASRVGLAGLMLIGGGLGSAAGGVGLWLWLGRRDPRMRVAASRVLLTMAVVIGGVTFGLAITEPYGLDVLLFEAISAVSGGGLSLGVTGDLTDAGRLMLMVGMGLGRVLPLGALAWAVRC